MGRVPKKIAKRALGNLITKLDEEAEHILRLIDAELKGTEEYNACKNDPKKAVAVVFNAKQGWKPKEPTPYGDVAIRNLTQKVGAIFARLPRTRTLTIETFYTHKLPTLHFPEDARDKLKRAGAQEAIASIRDEDARKVALEWVSTQKSTRSTTTTRRKHLPLHFTSRSDRCPNRKLVATLLLI